MESTISHLFEATTIFARDGSSNPANQPPMYKAVGIILAISSGVFIGVSFVLKKKGLLKANVKYNEEAGEGFSYLKNAWWWSGMTLMIIGEICNFVAYAFVDAILVTPMGALSVVVTTILSAIFLKERLSFIGKIGCFNCIIGAVIIALNAPQQSSVSDIQQMQSFVIAPGFLSYAGVIIVGCLIVIFVVAPRYGKKSMFVYLSICSLIGGLSVVATQGLGAAILAQIRGMPQFNQWFTYVLLVFVIASLLTEIIYLNKALNIFNAALVTPTYYVFFTSSTIITSAVLFQGFKGSVIAIVTMVMGFFVICSGVVLLQLSKSAKDVPDAAVFKGDLDQIREVAEQEQPESEPKADAIRGTAAIIRRFSVSRQKMEEEEAKRYFQEKQEDELRPPVTNEVIEWDGLRRRKTIIGNGPTTLPRTPGTVKSPHPPLGMSRFPEPEEELPAKSPTSRSHSAFLDGVRSRASTVLRQSKRRPTEGQQMQSPMYPVALTEIAVHPNKDADTAYHGSESDSANNNLQPPIQRGETPRSIVWVDDAGHERPVPSQDSRLAADAPAHTARRQFSFQFLNPLRSTDSPRIPASPGRSILKRSDRNPRYDQRHVVKNATEEEQLGLVKGDSHQDDEDEYSQEKFPRTGSPDSFDSTAEEQSEEDRQHFTGRSHQGSVSSGSTTAFPPYEDLPPQHTRRIPYLPHPSDKRIHSSESAAATTATSSHRHPLPHHHPLGPINASSMHSARPPHGHPSFTAHSASLPPIPAEEAADGGEGGTTEPYVRVDLRTPTHSHSSPELGVASLSSSIGSASGSPPLGGHPQERRGRRQADGSWRRDGRSGSGSSSVGSRSRSESSEGEHADATQNLVRRGAFI